MIIKSQIHTNDFRQIYQKVRGLAASTGRFVAGFLRFANLNAYFCIFNGKSG